MSMYIVNGYLRCIYKLFDGDLEVNNEASYGYVSIHMYKSLSPSIPGVCM